VDLYAWTLSLAALALALRFVPYSDDHGNFDAAWSLVIVAFGVIALAATIYLVYTLEILKFKRFRERQLRRQATLVGGEPPSADQLEDTLEREIETGDFEAVGRE
jgi:UDP-GlcNAc:undecaprenyl-phosphate/decaprenyl-phosphate GlcNAc-1-phosphate transferase